MCCQRQRRLLWRRLAINSPSRIVHGSIDSRLWWNRHDVNSCVFPPDSLSTFCDELAPRYAVFFRSTWPVSQPTACSQPSAHLYACRTCSLFTRSERRLALGGDWMRAGMPPLNQVLVAYRPTGEDGCQPLCRDGVVTTLPPLVSSDLGGPVMAPAVCTLPDQRLVMPSELAPMSHSGLPAPVLTIPLARGVTSQPMHVCRPAMPSVMVSAPTQQLLAPLPNYVNYVNHQALPLLPVYIASQPQQSFTIQPVQSSHHAASTVVEATQTQQFVAQPPILVSHRSPPMVPSPTQQIFTQELPAASDATPPLTSISLQWVRIEMIRHTHKTHKCNVVTIVHRHVPVTHANRIPIPICL